MQRAYRAATKASIDELDALEGRIQERLDNGEEPSDTILWMRQRIIDNIAQLGQNLKKFSIEGAQITADGQRESAILANEATLSMAEAAAGKKPAAVEVSMPWTTLPDEQLQAFVGMAGNGSPLGELFAKIPQVTEDAMLSALASGISLGEGPRTVARRVRKVAEIGRHRAETIARTEMIRSAREAQRMLYQQNPAVQSYRRVATQDARVCLACLALSGTVHTTDEIMPSHPNCRCVMVPVTLTWAEITGDPNIPDTSPPVVTPEVILAGLSDEDKLKIMGARRLQAYKDGLPLQDMVQVKQNADWGPTTSILPLSQLGQPTPKPKQVSIPKPNQAEAPKPIQDATPSINRDPQALLNAFRKIAGRTALQVADEIDALMDDRWNFISTYNGPRDEALAKWLESNGEKLKALEEENKDVKAYAVKQMHKLMFSDNPLKVNITPLSKVKLDEPNDQRIPPKYRKAITDAAEYLFKFIDSRPLENKHLENYTGSLTDVNIVQLTKKKVGGNYSPASGRVSVSKEYSDWDDTFTQNFTKTNSSNILAHELIHWLDDRDPVLYKKVGTFFETRTQGDAEEPSWYGGTYKKDKWFDAYCGKIYEIMGRQGWEVPTRGMEYLLQDPLQFAETDFEYFSFMIENVLGTGK
jgi:SPP1 gp7 family putative phage head morphogenesis protein